jgi:hypothetical protein
MDPETAETNILTGSDQTCATTALAINEIRPSTAARLAAPLAAEAARRNEPRDPRLR